VIWKVSSKTCAFVSCSIFSGESAQFCAEMETHRSVVSFQTPLQTPQHTETLYKCFVGQLHFQLEVVDVLE